ncbi:DnaD domain-containing protein [Bacillus shivajii]|uniref:DnaD domain-containing protein n=1 Tax=Bacillus shivajii TaxID=1983719 RepID=UPI001CF93669|nr:DnaD domain-containing protein [Bacillus shivajii]UCZ54817.1 DnaD domain-containing protein [Bacillus shivajii]
MNEEAIIQLQMSQPFAIPSALMTHYSQLGLSEVQFMILMHIRQFEQEGNMFPTPYELQERMYIDESNCTNELKELLRSGFIAIEEKKDEDGKLSEAFSLKPLFEKFVLLLNDKQNDKQQFTKQQLEGQLFRRFEEEFARPLSPMELEMISMWLDDDAHDPEIIEAALREAVVSSKLNFRYIDRILFDWKKNGVKTIQQAKEHGEKVRQHHEKRFQNRTQATPQSDKVKHPQYNWLYGEED